MTQCNMSKGSCAEAFYFQKSFPFSSIDKYLPNSPDLIQFDIKNQHGFYNYFVAKIST